MKQKASEARASWDLVLRADAAPRDEAGWRNLIKLVSRSFMETDATSEPRVSLGDLLDANEEI
mgnify:CR=1 FL=1